MHPVGFTVTRLLALSVLTLLTMSFAQNEVAQLMVQTTVPLLEQAEQVSAVLEFCQTHAPAQTATARDAAARWYVDNGVGAVYAVKHLYALSGSDEGFLAAVEEMREGALRQLEAGTATAEVDCANLAAILASFSTAATHGDGIKAIRSFHGDLDNDLGSPPLPPGKPLPDMTPLTYADLRELGLDPRKTVVPDEFHCYAERAGNDYSFPDLLVQFLPGGGYRSSFGEGSYDAKEDGRNLVFETGIFAGEESSLDWNHYGQAFELDAEVDGYDYSFQCYGRGARAAAALVDFRLGDPQPGSYSCTDLTTNKKAALALAPGNRYSLNGETGSYLVTELIDEYATPEIRWQTGPLARQTAEYFEDAGTGYRRFSMSLTETETGPPLSFFSSSESTLSVVCTGQGEPVTYPVSSVRSEPPPANAGGLSGMFYTLVRDEEQATDVPRFQTFFSGGYVFLGPPPARPEDLDCSLTKPNGEPRCAAYSHGDGALSLINATPEQVEQANATAGLNFNPVESGITTLDGTFWAGSFSTSGMPVGLDGISFSEKKEFRYSFSSDGRFVQQSSSETTSSDTGAGIASTYAFGEGNSQNAGDYSISGNTLTFSYDDGRVLEHFIMISDPAHFYLDGYAYSLEDE